MKIDSAQVTAKIPFLAVDATDMLTKLTGLTTFTVYRSRNGSTPIAMTTPTIAEADEDNMPGLYWLTVDEDTTIDTGYAEQTMVLHITHAGMYPVDMAVGITAVGNRLPEALEDGFLKTVTKKVGNTLLTPSGSGGQKYGAG